MTESYTRAMCDQHMGMNPNWDRRKLLSSTSNLDSDLDFTQVHVDSNGIPHLEESYARELSRVAELENTDDNDQIGAYNEGLRNLLGKNPIDLKDELMLDVENMKHVNDKTKGLVRKLLTFSDNDELMKLDQKLKVAEQMDNVNANKRELSVDADDWDDLDSDGEQFDSNGNLLNKNNIASD